MRNEGFICLWRKTQYDPIWFNSTPEQKAIFITLLFMANWKEQKYDIFGNEITLEAGSFIGSYTQIAKLTGKGVSIRNVRTAIDRFEKMGFLTRKPTKRGTLIIIVNWRKYQDKDYETDTETDIELTRHRHKTDTAPTQDRHAHKRTIQPSNQVTIKPSNQKDIPPISPRGGRIRRRKIHSMRKEVSLSLHLQEAMKNWRKRFGHGWICVGKWRKRGKRCSVSGR